jgi:dTMP kinase
MAEPGRLITFEGGEGAGKTTQIARLARRLERAGLMVEVTREPGGTEGAEAIRDLFLAGEPERWLPMTELLLLLAARHEHVARRIRPALAAGRWVLCDRFSDSTRAYQGAAGALGAAVVERLHKEVLNGFAPALTLILDLPVAEGLARRRRTVDLNRLDRRDLAFHEQVRTGFLAIAKAEPERCLVIDASLPAEQVEQAVAAAVAARFGLTLDRGR